ncbi:ATP-binding protein [Streptomyces zagrosensis]|uniref:Anti-sigma regulatory factor (Ser/Thr protein kinase) n=1 Tax=Streptomyces zagrosensis TaxID=1042984 RepID=A0A7W9UXN3_9ACTN|nr:ATP-binding protein [Streptomyces zagrosensis]MBB5934486.1 anti-sigma regulatory factor (Ser/Thr protein kinase) [Streptomyces zagrosensis]
MSEPRVWGRICPGSREEVTHARQWTRDILRGHPCADDAVLIVSELTTNALTHTDSGTHLGVFHITLTLTCHRVSISVTDTGGGTTPPHRAKAPAGATHGRGLDIVAILARHFHVTGNQNGRTVTAELSAPIPGERGGDHTPTTHEATR